jgi:hypothetical protein
MAKRAAPDERPYRPLLDADLVSAALTQSVPRTVAGAPAAASVKVLEMPRTENTRRPEPSFAEPMAATTETAPRLVEATEPVRSTVQSLVEKFDQEKRILFTRSESQAIDRLVVAVASRLNAQVKVSHVIRALVGLLLHAEAEIDRRAGETGPLVRPANGDAQGLQRFEREIAKIIAAALRDAGPVR